MRQAERFAKQHRWAEAAAAVRPFATDSVGRRMFADLSVNAGVAAFRANDRKAARRSWEDALRADPGSEDAALDLAMLLAAEGRADSAVLRLQGLRSLGAYESATRLWMGIGRVDLASGFARRGLDLHPRSGSLLTLLGNAEATRQHWPDAAAAYRRAAPLLPQAETAELPLLDALVAAGDTAEALALLHRLGERPASRQARMVVAALADSLGARSLAEAIYASLIAADSGDIDALEADGRLAERSGDTARAVDRYTRAFGVDSSGPEGPLALVRLTRPGPDSTRALLRRALWRGMDALQRLELSASGMIGDAGRSMLDPVSRIQREHRRRVHEALVATLDRAVLGEPWGPADLEQLRLAWPRSALLAEYAARLAEQGGDAASAVATLERLLRADPADAALQRTRGRLLERLGRSADAAEAYARSLDIAPEDDSTFRALERLAEPRGTLRDVLAQVRRLRIRLPESRALADHETEVLERLGEPPRPPERSSPQGGGRP